MASGMPCRVLFIKSTSMLLSRVLNFVSDFKCRRGHSNDLLTILYACFTLTDLRHLSFLWWTMKGCNTLLPETVLSFLRDTFITRVSDIQQTSVLCWVWGLFININLSSQLSQMLIMVEGVNCGYTWKKIEEHGVISSNCCHCSGSLYCKVKCTKQPRLFQSSSVERFRNRLGHYNPCLVITLDIFSNQYDICKVVKVVHRNCDWSDMLWPFISLPELY